MKLPPQPVKAKTKTSVATRRKCLARRAGLNRESGKLIWSCIGGGVDLTGEVSPNQSDDFPSFSAHSAARNISALYGTIVAQARMPCFYREYGVPDTLSCRFELIVLHLALVFDRLAKNSALRDLGQALFDHFCRDMDANLRKIGIGDLAVPKHMRRMGEAFYGRALAYKTSLATAGAETLAEALARNIYGGSRASPAAARLAAYVRAAVGGLAGFIRFGCRPAKLSSADTRDGRLRV